MAVVKALVVENPCAAHLANMVAAPLVKPQGLCSGQLLKEDAFQCCRTVW